MATPPDMNDQQQCQFVSSSSADVLCRKCGHLANRPATISCCEETFCSACIAVLQDKSQPCPSCGDDNFTSMKDSLTSIKVLGIPCTYRSRGCLWSDSLDLLQFHLDSDSDNCCQYMDIHCPLGCHKEIQKNLLKVHMSDECLMRLHTCPYCPYQASYEEVMDTHLPKCKFAPSMDNPDIYGEVLDKKFNHYLGDLQKSIEDLKGKDQNKQKHVQNEDKLRYSISRKDYERMGKKTRPLKRMSDIGAVSQEELAKDLLQLETELEKIIKIDCRREKRVQTDLVQKNETLEEANIEIHENAKEVSSPIMKIDHGMMTEVEVEADSKSIGSDREQREEIMEIVTRNKKTEKSREERNTKKIAKHHEVTFDSGVGESTKQAGKVDMTVQQDTETEKPKIGDTVSKDTEGEGSKDEGSNSFDPDLPSIDWDTLGVKGFALVGETSEKWQAFENCLLTDSLDEIERLDLENKIVNPFTNEKDDSRERNEIMAKEKKMLEHDKRIGEQETKLREIGEQIQELERKIDQRREKVDEHEKNIGNLMEQLDEMRKKIDKEDKVRKTEEQQKMQYLEKLLEKLKATAEKDHTLPLHAAALEEQKQMLKELEKTFKKETVIASEEQTAHLVDKISALERRLHQDFEELRIRWQQESPSLTDMAAGNKDREAVCTLNQVLKIEDFSTHAGKKTWHSPAMYSESNRDGYKFCVEVGTFLTGDVFAEILAIPGENDDMLVWPVTAEFSIELVRQDHGTSIVCDSTPWTWDRPSPKKSVRLGYFGRVGSRILLHHSELRPFLLDNTLNLFIANVNVKSSSSSS